MKVSFVPTTEGAPVTIAQDKFYPLSFINEVVTGDENKLNLTRKNYIAPDMIIASGEVDTLVSRYIPVPNTKRYFKLSLERILNDSKIDYSGVYRFKKLSPEFKEIAIISHGMADVQNAILKRNNNIASESMFKVAASKKAVNGIGTFDEGLAILIEYCNSLRLKTDDIKIVDASGVSEDNLLTAEFTASFLANPANICLKSLLPTAGEGTLANRMNYMTGGYEGYLNASLTEQYAAMAPALGLQDATIADINLKCDQKGWGITPILGADFKLNKLNIGLKYEFKANLNIENVSSKMELINVDEAYLADYKEGVNTPSDIPSMLSVAAGYEFLPNLRASVEYHFFDDKHAGMASDRQKTLNHGTHEYLAGIEWDVMKYITVSGGFQKTNYGLSDDFQTDTSFYCDSYSLGFGARIYLSKSLNMDIAYFWTNYSDYTKESDNYYNTGTKGTNIYSRTNKVFGLSLNYNF